MLRTRKYQVLGQMYVEDVLLLNQRKLDAYVYRFTPYLLVDSEITVARLIMYRRVNQI